MQNHDLFIPIHAKFLRIQSSLSLPPFIKEEGGGGGCHTVRFFYSDFSQKFAKFYCFCFGVSRHAQLPPNLFRIAKDPVG